jgi:hypothetical protein
MLVTGTRKHIVHNMIDQGIRTYRHMLPQPWRTAAARAMMTWSGRLARLPAYGRLYRAETAGESSRRIQRKPHWAYRRPGWAWGSIALLDWAIMIDDHWDHWALVITDEYEDCAVCGGRIMHEEEDDQ